MPFDTMGSMQQTLIFQSLHAAAAYITNRSFQSDNGRVTSHVKSLNRMAKIVFSNFSTVHVFEFYLHVSILVIELAMIPCF